MKPLLELKCFTPFTQDLQPVGNGFGVLLWCTRLIKETSLLLKSIHNGLVL